MDVEHTVGGDLTSEGEKYHVAGSGKELEWSVAHELSIGARIWKLLRETSVARGNDDKVVAQVEIVFDAVDIALDDWGRYLRTFWTVWKWVGTPACYVRSGWRGYATS